MPPNYKHPALFILVFIFYVLLSACSTLNRNSAIGDLPVLSQDELVRPYTKLGRIQVTREVYGSDVSLSPEINTWGLTAVRQEAEKMGADAVMSPEITGRKTSYGIIQSTEYIATAFAIKFK